MDLGRLDYKKAWDIQLRVHELRVKDEIPDTLIFVEHPHVITLGRFGKPENLLTPIEELKRRGVSFYRVERGGDITYHGPGQLVGYPIFSIKNGYPGIRAFIERMEDALIYALRTFGIEAEKKEGYIGVWLGEEKLAAIGVAVKRWITFHGFALNVNTDLDYFKLIRPCGLIDKGVTSIEERLKKRVNMDEAKERVKEGFEKIFNLAFSEVKYETIMDQDKDSHGGEVR